MDEKTFEELDYDRVIAQTAKAVLVRIDEDEHWVPRSVTEDHCRGVARGGGAGTLMVEQWFLEKEGLV